MTSGGIGSKGDFPFSVTQTFVNTPVKDNLFSVSGSSICNKTFFSSIYSKNKRLNTDFKYYSNFIYLIKLSKLKSGLYRSSHQRCSMKKGLLRNFAKFTGKHLYQSLSFNKVAGFRRPATLLKERLWHRCFPVNFAKFLRTTFLQNTSG